MQALQRFVIVAFSLVAALTSHEAWAQNPSITGIEGAVLRCEPPVTGTCTNADAANGNPHQSAVLDNTINFEDCEANLAYQFELGISSPSTSYNLEVWAGTEDCSQLANRQTAATTACWPVFPFVASLVNPFIANVRVRDIAAGAFGPPSVVYGGATGLANSDDAVCRSQTHTGPTALTLYFFFSDAEGNPTGTVQQYPVTLDLLAGNVQGDISLDVGDNSLTVLIPPTTDPSTQGYNIYCDLGGGASDAGASDAGSGNCAPSSVLVPSGEIGSSAMALPFQYGEPDTKYICGYGSASTTSVNVSELKNGSSYDVAVATVDSAGNVGPLSNVACGEPLPSAGPPGVSCSTQGAGAPVGTGGLGVLAVASIVAMARRRKQSAR